jgi:uncharacterized membrane protein YgdD (TMEM256/DUF423 family)
VAVVVTALWLCVAVLERKRAACFAAPMKSTLRLAAVAGILAVALGAFGAHGLRSRLELLGTTRIWEKAALYHLAHAVALLALALGRPVNRWVPWLFAAGIVIFSGSLYALALTKIDKLGAITPVGGVCFLVGWAMLGCCTKEPAQK